MAAPSGSPTTMPRSSRGSIAMRASHFTWCDREHGDLAGKSDRLLLRRVRAASVAADLRRRPRRAGRRSLQGSQRPRRAAHRRRLHVSAGLLPSEPDGRRLAAGGLREAQLDAARRSSRRSRRTASRASPRCRSGNRTVLVAVWRVRVGRVMLYLLDTDLEENAPWDRDLSARLYGGDRETRVQQEIILGIGGVRVLKAMGCDAGGLSPQRRARRVRRPAADSRPVRGGCELRERARGSAPHHGVHDAHAGARPVTMRFRSHLVETHLAGAWGDLGGYRERFLALGHHDNGGGADVQHDRAGAAHQRRGQRRQPSARRSHQADVAVDLARRAASRTLPVRSITNGVHVPTWMSSEIGALLERHLGPNWLDCARRSRRDRSRAGHPRRGTVGRAAVAAHVPVQLHPRARAHTLDARARERGAASSPRRRCSTTTR